MPPKRRLSETSDGSEQAGVEEDITTGVERVEEEAEKVRVGPGRPKKKKVDPSQQLQVLTDVEPCNLSNNSWNYQLSW